VPNPNKKVVTVYEASADEYKVYPPIQTLNFADANGPEILVVKNKTNDDLVVYADAGPFDVQPVAVPLAKGGKVNLKCATQGAGDSNLFTYHVLVPKSGRKAKGNSDPVVIVEN
jgi:hypothetical protein